MPRPPSSTELPIGGEQTIGSRAWIEDGCSHLLWMYFKPPVLLEIEEGLTEPDLRDKTKLRTNWRKAEPK